MNKPSLSKFTLSVSAVLLLGYSSVNAQLIGVQTYTALQPNNSPLTSSQIAGVIPQAHFNTLNTIGDFSSVIGPLSLVDSTGAGTGISLTLTNNSDAYFTGTNPSGTANDILLSGQSGDYLNGPATYTFDGVAPGSYDIIVYTVTNNDGELGDVKLSAGTTSGASELFVTEQNGDNFNGTFILSTATSAGAATLGNYVEFLNVSPVDGTIQFQLIDHSNAGGGDGINGFQLQEVQDVPEPSSLALMSGSAALLLLLGYRRRFPRCAGRGRFGCRSIPIFANSTGENDFFAFASSGRPQD